MYSTPWVHAINYAVSTEITSSLWWWWWCHCNDVDHKKVITKILKVPQLQVGTDSEGEIDEIFFIWPTTLVTHSSSCSSYIWLYLYKISMSGAQDFSSRCTKLTARALSTAWALATSWRSVTRSSFSSKELLSRLATPFRWALNLWPHYSNKQTNSLRSKASHAITAGSLVLPAERGAVGLPLCQSAQL